MDDLISRQAAIDGINQYFHDEYYQRTSIQDCRDCLIEDVIKPLPPVTPQPKTGHWIDTGSESFEFHRVYKCSECGNTEIEYPERICRHFRYCPNCGARMIEI